MFIALTAVLLAAGPRAPADAQGSLYIPKWSALSDASAFIEVAQTRSALLNPRAWESELHPLLSFNPLDTAALRELGIDINGPATISQRGDLLVSCVTLSDVKRYEERCARALAPLGAVWKTSLEGATVIGAKDSLGRVLAAYALKGKESCAARAQGQSVEKQMPAVAKLLSQPAAGAGWKAQAALKGIAYFVSPHGAVAATGRAKTLLLDGRALGLPAAMWAKAGNSPYAQAAPAGLGWARLRLKPEALAGLGVQIASGLQFLCPGCALREASQKLAATMTGNGFAYFHSVRIVGSLQSKYSRLFAVRQAWLFELRDAQVANEAVTALGWKKVPEGEMLVGTSGNHFYIANDRAALDAALAAVADSAGKTSHAVELSLTGQAMAKGLAQVPLFDALGSPEVAGLLAASAEAGPLLVGTERLEGWADAEGATQLGHLEWTLK